MSRATATGSTLIVAAILIVFGIVTRGWLEAKLDDNDRQSLGRNLGTVSLGLNGAKLCEPGGGSCYGDWYYGRHLKEDISLRVSSRIAFAGGVISVVLCLVCGTLILLGKVARAPATAAFLALLATGAAVAFFHFVGTSADNEVVRWWGWRFHAGISFYVTTAAIVAAVAALNLRPSPAPATYRPADKNGGAGSAGGLRRGLER